jgi:phage terminase large subunit-like protein
MPRSLKSLAQYARTGTFRAERHAGLLAREPLVEPEGLRAIQSAYLEVATVAERAKLAREFERAAIDYAKDVQASPLEAIRAMDLAEFGETFVRDPKGHLVGRPFVLEGWQRDFGEEFDRLDVDGQREYSLGLLGVPRANGKTAYAALRAVWELVRRPHRPEVFFAAGSKEQARIAFEFAETFVRESDALSGIVTVADRETLKVRETNGVLTVLPIGTGAFGLAPTVTIADELWLWDRELQAKLWTALITTTEKAPQAYLLAISTAPERDGSILAELLAHELAKPFVERPHDCLQIVQDREAGTLTWWYGAPEDADLDDEKLWRRSNPASFKSDRGLRRLRRKLEPGTFALLHLNRFGGDETDALVKRAIWEGCKSDLQIPDGGDVYCGAEADYNSTVLALTWCWRHPDRRVVLRAKIWSTNPDVPAHEYPETLSCELLEREIASLAQTYRVKAITFSQGPPLLEPLRRRTDITVHTVYAGSKEQAEANRSLFGLIQGEQIAHNADPVLQAHVLGVKGTWDSHERLNVYKLKQDRPAGGWYSAATSVGQLPDPDAVAPWAMGWGSERDQPDQVLRALGLL